MNDSRLLRPWIYAVALSAVLLLVSTPGSAQLDNQCDPGEAPDVIVGDLPEERRHGTQDGITAFSIGTTSCNVGSCELQWIDNNNQHPVIGANMYRMKDGRFEQIGMSWLKHGFFALSQGLCSDDCISTNGDTLGVNCSDPYTSFLNGQQSGLGPRSEVNASTGEYPYPFTTIGQGGSTIYKRLQVHNDDLDPAKNAGATYWVEGQYVTADDAAAGNLHNNVSYREINVTGSGTFFDISMTGVTTRMRPAVFAWRASQSGVLLRKVTLDGDGQYYVVSAATDNGDGTWHYEYAVHNLNSHRSAGSFSVPLPAGTTVTNVGFHDVDYHSGEPYTNQDWFWEVDPEWQPNTVVWYTEAFEDNENANALRWGTLYNFRFDADMPPNSGGTVDIGLFRPGTPSSLNGWAYHPALCNSDGICDPTEDCVNCPDDCLVPGGEGGEDACCGDGFCDPVEDTCACSADCGVPLAEEFACDNGVDDDCDGQADCSDGDCCADGNCEDWIDDDSDLFANCDCDDANDKVWERPGEVPGLDMAKHPSGTTILDWDAPAAPGGDELIYSTVRSSDPSDFLNAICVPTGDPAQRTITELETPGINSVFYYLIRAENECPAGLGEGDMGSGSDNVERAATSCP
jgi:hypothetical protein